MNETMLITDLDTPALLVDLERMEQNIARMAELARKNHVNLRPHTKTHKCPEIARMQIEQGATGITCAKLGEAEVMANAGLNDILIANEIIGDLKLKRLVELSKKAKVCVAVDSQYGAKSLNAACQQAGTVIDVLIEINSGQNRCGVLPGAETLQLAKKILRLDYINLQGLMTHAGQVYNQVTLQDIKKVGLHESRLMVTTATLLRDNGIKIDTISVGSTPAAAYCAGVDGITEIRPGTYVFNDLTQVELFSCALENCALFVLATVVSRPAPNRAVIDAGKKALTSDLTRTGDAGFGFIPSKNVFVTRLSEEHGVIESGVDFKIGEKLKVIPNHVCVVVNMFDKMYGFRGDHVERVFEISARGKMQ